MGRPGGSVHVVATIRLSDQCTSKGSIYSLLEGTPLERDGATKTSKRLPKFISRLGGNDTKRNDALNNPD